MSTPTVTAHTESTAITTWSSVLATMVTAVIALQYLETARDSGAIGLQVNQLKNAADKMNTQLTAQTVVVQQHIGNSDLPYQQQVYNNYQLQGQSSMTPLQNGIDQGNQIQSDIESGISTVLQGAQSLGTIPQNTNNRTN